MTVQDPQTRPARPASAPEPRERAPYTRPRLERLGAWSELTLLQAVSIPVGPGA